MRDPSSTTSEPGPAATVPEASRNGAADSPAFGRELRALSWLPLAHGAITMLFGVLLVAVPDRTLTFVAVVAGISLCVAGVINLAEVLRRGLPGRERFGVFLVGLLALVAGAVVIARPEGSIKTVAIVAGVYLLIMGAVTLFLGAPGVPRLLSLLRGALGLAAGAALLVWPDVTVGVIATVYGVFLLLVGAAEIVFSRALRRSVDTGHS
jgi:uncharacterized membrane protein HdeD (DUF308 family)